MPTAMSGRSGSSASGAAAARRRHPKQRLQTDDLAISKQTNIRRRRWLRLTHTSPTDSSKSRLGLKRNQSTELSAKTLQHLSNSYNDIGTCRPLVVNGRPAPSHSSAVCDTRAAIHPMRVEFPVFDFGSRTSAATVTSAQSIAPMIVYGAVSAVRANQPMGICGVRCLSTPSITSKPPLMSEK
eukprot:SAG22_NODE_212_length_15072_cov_3.109197_3_plen_183_part_00